MSMSRMNQIRMAILSIFAIAVIALLTPTHAAGQANEVTPLTRELIAAIRAGGIPAAATLVGHYVRASDGDVHMFAQDLTDLARNSDVVIRASIDAIGPSQLTADKTSITTDHVVTIMETFQGSLQNGTQTVVRMEGGFIRFRNNTTAEVRNSRTPKMKVGQSYILFLERTDPVQPFALALGPQSIFTFGQDGKTISLGRNIDPVFEKYNGMPRDQFLQTVWQAAKP